jgi:CoB--CoM heterodisulfide reductase subunit B
VAEYAYFWGCLIPSLFPYIEKSVRLALDDFGVPARDIEGFTCCPQSIALKGMGEEAWVAVAARNLCLAEQEGLDIVTACNGCYETLKKVSSQLRTDLELKERINGRLARVGMTYRGTSRVRHFVEVLNEDVGTGMIARRARGAFRGFRFAVHHGCHLVRPGRTLRLDDPFSPDILDELVRSLGAVSIEYESKMTCCGGGLALVGDEDVALAMAEARLREMLSAGADLLCVICPACFAQYDARQATLQARGVEVSLPIVYYSELLCLALGHSPEELGLKQHAIKLKGFLADWAGRSEALAAAAHYFDIDFLAKCVECRACLEDCPSAASIEEFRPDEMFRAILNGQLEEVITSPAVWQCLECHTCHELCPDRVGMSEIFATLRRLATEQDRVPRGVKEAMKTFRRDGILSEVIEVSRKRLGLPESQRVGIDELKVILGEEGEPEE